MSKTIDCTPSWSGILNWYITVLQDGNAEGKKIAKKELSRMAQSADNWVEHCKEVNSRIITMDGEQTTIGEFIAANTAPNVAQLSNEDMQYITELHIGEDFYLEGGAAGTTVITRIS